MFKTNGFCIDSTLADLSVAGLSVTQYGLPPLHTSDIPTCGTNYTNACDEEGQWLDCLHLHSCH